MGEVTLKQIRENVRKYLGLSTASQISDEELNQEINHFYTEQLPAMVYLDETRSLYTFEASNISEYSLPDNIINVFPPCRVNDVIVSFYYDPTLFWSKYAGASAGLPKAVLLVGRTLKLAPPADAGPYEVILVALQKPATLISDADVLIADYLEDVVELGTTISISLKQGDDDSVAIAQRFTQYYLTLLQSLNMRVDVQALKDIWGRRMSQTPTVAQQPMTQTLKEG